MRSLLVLLLVALIVGTAAATPPTVTVNKTYSLDSSNTTPFNVWAGSIIIGLLLLGFSLVKFPHGEEVLVSIAAWIPVAYAMFNSFTVDTVTSSVGSGVIVSGTPQFVMVETHTVHSYPIIAVILFVILMGAIGNTIRIVMNQMEIKKLSQAEPSWHERHMNGGL